MKLVLNIEPKPQSRPRFTRHGRAFEDRAMKRWRQGCTRLIRKNYTGQLLVNPVKIKVIFYIEAPQYIRRMKYVEEELRQERIYCAKRPDLDNYIKALYSGILRSY
ncbi:RusA family crossover junction endodeoxyribonuclease [Streptococcus cuniculipharyngis]|uniref:RusA family crossover junction endodeoxyribonuclease n=1 Tax=Streptococcus cuniculipharyngis TaxID=1562651 RepID=A0A5C5SFV7_9STRE|nr:RusA family crossover junction endodeoxyribonuclease [Streptococcus cuniculipharyngis]TWS99160.1 RusA family crossover junction endodeoxyribonuclease [Streptococcus cuniculipharyngis]